MASPFEIVSAPLQVYVAPEGTAFPAIQLDPPVSPWTLLGESGSLSRSEEGLTISHAQEFFEVKVDGSTATQKVYRTAESLVVSFTLYDLQAEEYSRILNDNTVTSVAAASGVAGEKSVKIYRDVVVSVHALLVRGQTSPEQDNANAQYELPKVWQNGSPELTFAKGEVAGLSFEYMALFDRSATSGNGLGVYRYQTQNPT